MIRLSPFSTRNQLPGYLSGRGLNKHAVEIGTHRGDYASIILKHWPGILYCIDPWDDLPGYEDQSKALPDKGETRQSDYEYCKRRLSDYRTRTVFMRATSKSAVVGFVNDSLDYVYIDGDHKKVLEDLYLWWPKVKSNGIVACHDWMSPGEPDETNWARWVQPDVQKFAEQESLDIWLVPEEGNWPWTAYLVKN